MICYSVVIVWVVAAVMFAYAFYVHLACICNFGDFDFICIGNFLPYLVMIFLWDILSELYKLLNMTDSVLCNL